jgi:hypothetical protein
MITDRAEARTAVAEEIVAQKWFPDMGTMPDSILDAIGFDELVASRERAMRFAVAMESTHAADQEAAYFQHLEDSL